MQPCHAVYTGIIRRVKDQYVLKYYETTFPESYWSCNQLASEVHDHTSVLVKIDCGVRSLELTLSFNKSLNNLTEHAGPACVFERIQFFPVSSSSKIVAVPALFSTPVTAMLQQSPSLVLTHLSIHILFIPQYVSIFVSLLYFHCTYTFYTKQYKTICLYYSKS